MRGNVSQTEGWYKDAYGPMLAFTREEGLPIALLPGTIAGYFYTDPKTGNHEKINAKTAPLFDLEAICFYRPLPQKKLGIPDLLLYLKRCVSFSDAVMIVGATLAVTLVGLLMPQISRTLTGPVMSSGRSDALIAIAICMVCVLLSSQLIGSANSMIQSRLGAKTSLWVEASMMMRLLSLPASFFRKYSPGKLTNQNKALPKDLPSLFSDLNMLCQTRMDVMFQARLDVLRRARR